MKTEKKGKRTRKVKGGSSLSPATLDSAPAQTAKVDTPGVKGGKKGSSLKNVLKDVEQMILKGGLKKSKKLRGGAIDLKSVTSSTFNDNKDHTTEARTIDLVGVDNGKAEETVFKAAVEKYIALDSSSADFKAENITFKNAFETYEKTLSGSGGGGPAPAPVAAAGGFTPIVTKIEVTQIDPINFTATKI
jgi:hypothetical protein